MKRTGSRFFLLLALLTLGFHGPALAGTKAVEVSLTNYTSGQPFNPLACVVHDGSFSLYELGEEASPELEALAEDAITVGLEALVGSEPGVKSVVVSHVPIGPGGTDTVVVQMGTNDVVSCATMLVNTNDTFTSITDVQRPKKHGESRFQSIALDAGTEQNDQLKEHIPGPCCMNMTADGVEEDSTVLGSPGVVAGLGALIHVHDWRGYVAVFTVRRK